MATYYVANWGSEDNDGLSWESAKNSINSISIENYDIFHIKGYYNETINTGNKSVKVYGYGTIFNGNFTTPTTSFSKLIDGINFENYSNGISNYFEAGTLLNNCMIKNAQLAAGYNSIRRVYSTYSIFNNCSYFTQLRDEDLLSKNCTFFNIQFDSSSNKNQLANNFMIFSNSDLFLSDLEYPYTYSLFIHCKFQLTGGGLGNDETAYSYPTGNTDTEKLQNLRERAAAVYGGQNYDYFIGCKYYSRDTADEDTPGNDAETAYQDIFVDADNDDFHLKADNPVDAQYMAWDGNYVGAKPVGVGVGLSSMTLSNIDATTGLIQDQETDATADTGIIDIGKERKITNISALGQRAMRNGQQVNTISNLSAPIAAGSTLTAGKIYMCIDDVITLDTDSKSYNPWEMFLVGTTQTFSTTGAGRVQEVYIDQYDEKITIQCSKTDSTLTGVPTITLFLHETPMVNVDTNGEPTKGNADAGYDEATAQSLYTQYIKVNNIVKANNLPAR